MSSAAHAIDGATSGGCRLLTAGAAGIAAIVVARCLVAFQDRVHFDVDPAFAEGVALALGPAGNLWLDVALLAACAVTLAGLGRARRRVDAPLVLLVVVGAAVVVLHGVDDLGDLRRGATWATALLAAVVLAHLRDRRLVHAVVTALLAAVCAPVLLRAGAQLSWEHADVLRLLESDPEAALRMRGLEPGSPRAETFLRRATQPDPLAWFATTNLLASLLAASVALWTGLAVSAVRARLASGWSGGAALVAFACLAGLVRTGSKGGIAVGLLGAALVLLPALWPVVRVRMMRWGGVVALSLVGAALLAIAVRAAMPDDALGGERSLLFRSHYAHGALQIAATHPFTGVGPDGFQDAYMLVRSPASTEEVRSSHNAFLDWTSMLGIAGLAWVAVVLVLLWRAGGAPARDAARAHERPDGDTGVRHAARGAALAALAAVGFVVIPVQWNELAHLPALDQLVRACGWASLVLLAALAGGILGASRARDIGWPLAVAAIVLVVHSQVEMTLFQVGTAGWALAVLGVAAWAPAPRWSSHAAATGAVVGIAALVLAVFVALPVTSHEARLAEAEREFADGDRLSTPLIMRRETAARMLSEAQVRWRWSSDAADGAAEQLLLAAYSAPPAQRSRLLEQALATLDAAPEGSDRTALTALRSSVLAAKAMVESGTDPGPATWNHAIDAARTLTERDPNGLSSWVRLGDVLFAAGRTADAAAAYRRALEVDAAWRLDPLRQLSDDRRREINKRSGT